MMRNIVRAVAGILSAPSIIWLGLTGVFTFNPFEKTLNPAQQAAEVVLNGASACVVAAGLLLLIMSVVELADPKNWARKP